VTRLFRHIPEPEGSIPACRDDPLPVGRESASRYGVTLFIEDSFAGPCFDVPEPEGLIGTPRGDEPAVGGESAA
jgi:hypothetical protein